MRALRYLLFPALLACAISTRADLAVALAASVQNGASGTELVFMGTLTNTSQIDSLFLNDIGATINGNSAAYLSLNQNAFFSNVPGILLPGESYSNDELFRIVLAVGAPSADYSGTVILRGGISIFANNDLANASFTILSPAISIVVSDPDASELGAEAGRVTVSRTGGTGLDLPVSLAITGTATNGISYNFISSPTTIVGGSSSVTLTVVPIPDNLAEGERTVVFSLTPSSSYNLVTSSSGIVTIHDKPPTTGVSRLSEEARTHLQLLMLLIGTTTESKI